MTEARASDENRVPFLVFCTAQSCLMVVPRTCAERSRSALIPQRTRDSLARDGEHKDAERSRSALTHKKGGIRLLLMTDCSSRRPSTLSSRKERGIRLLGVTNTRTLRRVYTERSRNAQRPIFNNAPTRDSQMI